MVATKEVSVFSCMNNLSFLGRELRYEDHYFPDVLRRLAVLSKHISIKTDAGKSLLDWTTKQFRLLAEMQEGRSIPIDDSLEFDEAEMVAHKDAEPPNDKEEDDENDEEALTLSWWMAFIVKELWKSAVNIVIFPTQPHVRSSQEYDPEEYQKIYTRLINKLGDSIDEAFDVTGKNVDLQQDVSLILSILCEHCY